MTAAGPAQSEWGPEQRAKPGPQRAWLESPACCRGRSLGCQSFSPEGGTARTASCSVPRNLKEDGNRTRSVAGIYNSFSPHLQGENRNSEVMIHSQTAIIIFRDIFGTN